MSWARFHASCRRHINQAGGRFDDTLAFYQSGASPALFGPVPGRSTLPSRLMIQLAQMSDHAAREDAIRTYAGVDFDALSSRPIGAKRVAAYLGLLAVCCIIMVSVVGMFVLPQMALYFQGTGMDLGYGLLAWHEYVPLLVAAVFLVCLFVMLQAVALGQLLEFRLGAGRRSLFSMLLSSSLHKRYGLLEGVICAPLPQMQTDAARHELQALQAQGLRWQDELPGLARVQAGLLVNAANQHAHWLLVIMGLVIAACVSTFVLGVYTPIFRMGSGL